MLNFNLIIIPYIMKYLLKHLDNQYKEMSSFYNVSKQSVTNVSHSQHQLYKILDQIWSSYPYSKFSLSKVKENTF